MFGRNKNFRERESVSHAEASRAVVESADSDVVAVSAVDVDSGLDSGAEGLGEPMASIDGLGEPSHTPAEPGLTARVVESSSGDQSIDEIHSEITALGSTGDFPASFGRIAVADEPTSEDAEIEAPEPEKAEVSAPAQTEVQLDSTFSAIWSNNMNAAHDQFLPSNTEAVRGTTVSPESPMYCTEQQIYQAQQGIQLSKELIKKGNIHTLVHQCMDIDGDVRLRENTGAALAGKVNGNVIVEGEGVLYIQATAVIFGCVVAPYIICEGQIEGEVYCNRLMAGETSVLKSDVQYGGNFVTLPGSDFSGRVRKETNALSNGYQMTSRKPLDVAKPSNVTNASFVAQASQIAATKG